MVGKPGNKLVHMIATFLAVGPGKQTAQGFSMGHQFVVKALYE